MISLRVSALKLANKAQIEYSGGIFVSRQKSSNYF